MPRPLVRIGAVACALVAMLAAAGVAGTAAGAQAARVGAAGQTGASAGAQPVAVARYDLVRDERRGGHTLARHIGRTDEQLRARLARESNVSAASTFTDLPTAERVVAQTLARNRDRVRAWLDRSGSRPNLALVYRGPRTALIGRSLRRGAKSAVGCVDAVVVLRWDERRSFYVLTSYPDAAR